MAIDLTTFLNRPLTLGGRLIRGRLVLAPMTYLGHAAFRELLAGFGGYGLLFSEMCSAKRLPHESPAASAFFRWRPQELPHLVCQIFGAEPEVMAAAAARARRSGTTSARSRRPICSACDLERPPLPSSPDAGWPIGRHRAGLFASRSNPVLIHTQYPRGPLDHPISSGGGGG